MISECGSRRRRSASPCSSAPSVTPHAAKITCLPGRDHERCRSALGSLIPIFDAFFEFFGIDHQPCDHLAVQAAQCRGCNDAFRSAAGSHHSIDTRAANGGGDTRR